MAYIKASASASGVSTSISVTHGLTIAENDLVIALINANGLVTLADDNGANAFTEDFGGTSGQYSGSATMGVYSRIAGASEPATYAFSSTASDRFSILILVVENYEDVGSIWDVAPSFGELFTGSASTVSVNPVTTSNNNSLALIHTGVDTGTVTNFSGPTNGFLEEIEEAATQASATFYKTIATAGSVGATSITLSGTTSHFSMMMAINNGTGGGGPTETLTV